MPKRTILNRILQLDPEKDHLEVVYLDTCYEFAFDTTRALEFALYRTYAVPSIGGLLDSTGEFGQRAQKRYDDTDLILSEIIEHGYDSERGRAAIRRMNQMHGRFPISNDDFLYVLSTFVYEPIRWNERFGWRRMVEQERLGAFYYWRTIGRYMNIQSLPDSYDEFEQFNREYEREHFQYTEGGRRVAVATRDMLLRWYLPGPLKRLGEPFVYAIMDEPLLDAFRFPKPSMRMRRFVEGSLRMRSRIARMLPERHRPRLRTTMRHRSYPSGYRIEELGVAPGPRESPT